MLKLLLALGIGLIATVESAPVAAQTPEPSAQAARASVAAPPPQAPSPQAAAPQGAVAAPRLPPAGFAAADPVHPDHVSHAGRRLGGRAADLPLLHPDPGQPAVGWRVGALRREDRGQPARGLQAAVGHQLPRRPVHRSARRPLRQRRDGQAHPLQAGRAAAGQDRGLHRQQEAGSDQDRGEAERREHPHPSRLVHRSGTDPEGRKRRAQLHGVQGLPVRRPSPTSSSRCRPGPSWSTSPSTSRKGRRSRSRRSSSRATRPSRAATWPAR